jgi:hypothetical protein
MRKISEVPELITNLVLNNKDFKDFYKNSEQKHKDIFDEIIVNDIKHCLMLDYIDSNRLNINNYITICEEV